MSPPTTLQHCSKQPNPSWMCKGGNVGASGDHTKGDGVFTGAFVAVGAWVWVDPTGVAAVT